MKKFSRWNYVEAVVLSILCLYFCCSALPKAWRTLNTDFPNYYLTARLVREHVDTTRAYEWIWIQREKDHRKIDQRVVGLAPITPFSTLLMLPVTKLAPLAAKHVWIAINLTLILALAFLLSSVSGLSRMQSGILLGLSVPLQRNLAFGQYYILLLFLLTAACCAVQQKRAYWCGALIGIAAALKVYPILFLLYFLRKKAWKSITACLTTLSITAGVSVAVLGWGMHRTYLREVLPWTLRGECLPPYNLASQSLSTLLHKLFVYEPQWNPHPVVHAAWLFAVLHPLLQAALMIPAVIWIDRIDTNAERTRLEWSGLLSVALTVSTITASYHLTVLILPVALLCGYFLRTGRYVQLVITICCFLAAGYPGWIMQHSDGWHSMLAVPRLYALVSLSAEALYALKQSKAAESRPTPTMWTRALASLVLISIATGLYRQRRLFTDYQYRVPMAADVLVAAGPVAMSSQNIAYVALNRDGYRVQSVRPLLNRVVAEDPPADVDQLSVALDDGYIWTEDVASHSFVRPAQKTGTSISDAESPVFSPDRHEMAFLRDVMGKKQLFMHDRFGGERQLTSTPMNVYEAAFLPDLSVVISATMYGAEPTLYKLGADVAPVPLQVGEARYPAASSDGRWLAYSRFVDGNWNLYLKDLKNGTTTRLTYMPCNQIEPSWEADSKTLLYATDCGRALWFTAIARRRVVP